MSRPSTLPPRRHRHRAAAALATVLVAAAAAAPAAHAAPSPSPSASQDPALYGKDDPTFDGVWRQSLALLALKTVKVAPSEQAVSWLLDQQCDDGGFPSYRASTLDPCDTATEDTNATAVAVQALASLGGRGKEIGRATAWLRGVQNEDGGWSFNPGGITDANSTSLVIGAFAAAGDEPQDVRKGGESPYDALASLQLGCAAAEKEDRGAFAYQPNDEGELYGNDSATAAGALGALGKGLPVLMSQAKDPGGASLDCTGKNAKDKAVPRADSARAALDHLRARIGANGGFLASPQKAAGPDHDTTARAGIALAAAGVTDSADSVVAWFEKQPDEWYRGRPAALADLVLLCKATAKDPRDFAGADLVTQLANLGPKPASDASGEQSAAEDGDDKSEKKKDDDDDGGVSVWLTVGIGLLIGVGAGYLISVRRKQG